MLRMLQIDKRKGKGKKVCVVGKEFDVCGKSPEGRWVWGRQALFGRDEGNILVAQPLC